MGPAGMQSRRVSGRVGPSAERGWLPCVSALCQSPGGRGAMGPACYAGRAIGAFEDMSSGRWRCPFQLVGEMSVGSAVAVVLRSACGAIKRNPRTAVRVSDSDSITSICCLDYCLARGQGGNGRRVTAPLGAGVRAAGTGCQWAGDSRGASGVVGNRSRVAGADTGWFGADIVGLPRGPRGSSGCATIAVGDNIWGCRAAWGAGSVDSVHNCISLEGGGGGAPARAWAW